VLGIDHSMKFFGSLDVELYCRPFEPGAPESVSWAAVTELNTLFVLVTVQLPVAPCVELARAETVGAAPVVRPSKSIHAS
jgi:hypothetical protein